MSKYIKVLISSILIIFASIGLGRFSYGMILPSLQESSQLSTTQAGFIGTSNFIGYFIALFFISKLYKKYEISKLIFYCLLFQALSMFAMTLYSNYLFISFFYTFSGFFAAVSNVSIMIYIAHIIPSNIKGKALGIIVTGIGFAIIFSGFIVPKVEQTTSTTAWEISWVLFSLLVLVIGFFVKSNLLFDTSRLEYQHNEMSSKELLGTPKFYKVAFLYLMFGITYVTYVTFFVTASIEKYNISTHEAGIFWSVLGLMSLISGPLFGYISDKIGAYKTLIINFIFLSIAYLILALDINSSVLWSSAVLFGLSAWAVPSLITVLSIHEFDVHNTAKVFSFATLIFDSGQIIGPLGAGYLYDIYGNFSNIFLLCTLLAIIAAFASFIFSLRVCHKEKPIS